MKDELNALECGRLARASRVLLTTVILGLLPVLVGCTGTTETSFDSGGPLDGGGDAVGDGPTDAAGEPDALVVTDALGDADSGATDTGDLAATDLVDSADTSAELTGSGTWDDPWVIPAFPFTHEADTRDSVTDVADSYACAASTNESGPELVYRLTAPFDGIVEVEVDDSAPDTDVDIHLLSEANAESCTVRDNTAFWEVIFDGDDHWLVVDSWTNSGGTELPGPYTLTVDVEPLPGGDCVVEQAGIEMFNRPDPLFLPAIGEVVREAHLVTTEEFDGVWPQSLRDGIEAHYALTEAASGYVMDRNEPWAPEGEGGSMWGQGSTARPPPLDETWYVNMYWRNRPDRGTRMLVYNPQNGQAVIGAAGYETGPGSALRIGGATEEVLHVLDATHRSRLLMGFLVEQSVDLGPIDCD